MAPWGFRLEPPDASALARSLPFVALPTPSRCMVRACGEVDERRLEIFEVDYSWRDSDGNDHSADALIGVIEVPWSSGRVAIAMDERAWSGVAAALDALFWIPPFTFLKLVQLANETARPDRTLGHAEVDRRYRVHAESEAAARAAFPERLGAHLLATNFRGSIEIRPGVVLFSLRDARFDPTGIESTIAHAREIGRSFGPPESGPFR